MKEKRALKLLKELIEWNGLDTVAKSFSRPRVALGIFDKAEKVCLSVQPKFTQ